MSRIRKLYAALVLIMALIVVAPLQFLASLISPMAVRFFDRVWARVWVHAMQIKGD